VVRRSPPPIFSRARGALTNAVSPKTHRSSGSP
jgi:hypothetical protein